MSLKSRIAIASTAAFVFAIFPIQSSSASVTQQSATAGEQQGSTGTGGAFTKSCPDGYVVFTVAVSLSTAFNYVEGFSFSCVNVKSDGKLGETVITFDEVATKVRDRSSMCVAGKALTGVRITLMADPNNASTFYVNDLGSNCAEFISGRSNENAGMARGTTATHSSTCSNGFVTGFAGRKGAGLDRVGVLCSTFTLDVVIETPVEKDPITNTLFSNELPTLASDATSLTCRIGAHTFLYRETVNSPLVIESAVFSLFLDGSRYASVSSDDFRILARWIMNDTPRVFSGIATTNQASWLKRDLPAYSLATCEVIAYQNHALALSTSRAS